MIVKKFPAELNYIRIYPIGDRHIGSRMCNENHLRSEVKNILNDPVGYVIMCGDMLDFGIKTAKTNTYSETMMPHEQKEMFADIYNPIKNRIIAAVPGNHCRRGVETVGINPMYDVFCRWGVEDVYREGVAIAKVSLGKGKNGKQITYAIVVSHGSSQQRHHRWATGYDGANLFISGHTHNPSYTPRGKIIIDIRNETIKRSGYKEVVVDSGLDYGDYASVKEYEISCPPELQCITLDGRKRKMTYISEDKE